MVAFGILPFSRDAGTCPDYDDEHTDSTGDYGYGDDEKTTDDDHSYGDDDG